MTVEPGEMYRGKDLSESQRDWPEFFAVKLFSDKKFCRLIDRIVEVVRKEPARPRGCYTEGQENVYLVSDKMYTKLITAYNDLQVLNQFMSEFDKMEKEGEAFNWREVSTTIRESLQRRRSNFPKIT